MGAPKGNKNAYKHGFYEDVFSIPEKKNLKEKNANLESEINALRIVILRILARLNEHGLQPDEKGEISKGATRSLHTLIDAMTAISTLARSHELITGKYLPVETAIMDALLELNTEEGI